MKDNHTVGKKMARNGRKKALLPVLFILTQTILLIYDIKTFFAILHYFIGGFYFIEVILPQLLKLVNIALCSKYPTAKNLLF